jgi:APA family basic amino acid/polyamine antiporter
MAKNQLTATKSIDTLLAEMHGGERLKRVLGPVSLTALGVGAIIGTGIFVLVGRVAADISGPSLMLSFVVAGLACVFAALCYAEFASMVPVAGSAYTYAYATLGELMAWIIGWDLILEYAVASATVAHGWSKYFQKLMVLFGVGTFAADGEIKVMGPDGVEKGLPAGAMHVYADAPFDFNPSGDPKKVKLVDGKEIEVGGGKFYQTGFKFDLPAIVIAALVTIILVVGIRESAAFNAFMVAVKVLVVIGVIGFGFFMITPENWLPFAPYGYGGMTFFGKPLGGDEEGGIPVGILAGAAGVVFAYLGFDAVSTQAEEAKNPGRDVPIGIIGSLVVCTLLYILMAAVLTGLVPFEHIDKNAPVSSAIAGPAKRVMLEPGQKAPEGAVVQQMPTGVVTEVKKGDRVVKERERKPTYAVPTSTMSDRTKWFAGVIVTLGALTGITSVLIVMMLGQPRIFLAMARDGLLPPGFFASVHPKFKTPWKSTILTGAIVATAASLLPLNILADLTSIGTLFAFVLVCVAVLIMRRVDPDRPRPFKVPFSPVFPLIGIVLCLVLMLSLPGENWVRLIVWLAVGFAVYFLYGYWNSNLRKRAEAGAAT